MNKYYFKKKIVFKGFFRHSSATISAPKEF